MTPLARALRRATDARLQIRLAATRSGLVVVVGIRPRSSSLRLRRLVSRRQLPANFTEADVAKAVAEVVRALREQAGDVPRLRVIPPASPRVGAC